MGRVIILVVVVLLVIAYAGMFMSWNMATVPVTGFAWGGQGLVEDAPLGFLILGGVLVGAIIMAAFTFGAYQAQRSRCAHAEHRVAMAKKKLDELVAKIKEQREKIAELEKGRGGKVEAKAEEPEKEPEEKAPAEKRPEQAAGLGEDEEEI